MCPDHEPVERWFNALPPDLQTCVQYARSTKEKVVAFVRRFKMPFTLAAPGGPRDLPPVMTVRD